MKTIYVYDTETIKMSNEVKGGWSNIQDFGMSLCVSYNYVNDEYEFFDENKKENVCELFTSNDNAGGHVVSFNGVAFDSVLLLGNNRTLNGRTVASEDGKYHWKEYDVYLEIMMIVTNTDNYKDCLQKLKEYDYGHGIYKLNSICMRTINKSKNGLSEDAPKLFKENKFYELIQYGLQDVRRLKQLYEFIKQNKYVINDKYDYIKF